MVTDIVMDIESLSTDSINAVVLAIGAVGFNRFSDWNQQFESLGMSLEYQSQIERGRHVNPKTEQFWSEQPESLREEVFLQEYSVPDALAELSGWSEKCSGDIKSVIIWGYDSLFDLGNIYSLYSMYGVHWPFHYQKRECLRTMCNEHPGLNQLAKKEWELTENRTIL